MRYSRLRNSWLFRSLYNSTITWCDTFSHASTVTTLIQTSPSKVVSWIFIFHIYIRLLMFIKAYIVQVCLFVLTISGTPLSNEIVALTDSKERSSCAIISKSYWNTPVTSKSRIPAIILSVWFFRSKFLHHLIENLIGENKNFLRPPKTFETRMKSFSDQWKLLQSRWKPLCQKKNSPTDSKIWSISSKPLYII
jgi:hypothetical protein